MSALAMNSSGDSFPIALPSRAAGRAAPAVDQEDQLSDRLGAADPRLADPNWMRRAYAEHGDMWIALETGAARKTVRKRREELGIQSAPPGRRRGVTIAPSIRQRSTHSPGIERILSRARGSREPATAGRAVEIFAAADRARRDHDRISEKNAWEQLAAHCIRMVEHLDAVDRQA